MTDDKPNRFQKWLDENPDKPEWLREKVRDRGSKPFKNPMFKNNGWVRDGR